VSIVVVFLLIIFIFNVFLIQYLYVFLVLSAGGFRTKRELFTSLIPGIILFKVLTTLITGIIHYII